MALDTTNKLSRLAGPANAGSGTSTVLTVSSGIPHIYTLKSIRVVNNTGAAITFKMGIGGVADANLISPAILLGAGELYQDDCFFVLAGTDTLQINTTATGLAVTVCGLDQS